MRIRFGRLRNQPALTTASGPPSRRRVWTRRLIVALAVFALAYVVRLPALAALGGWLNVSEPPRVADYVLVLGGDRQTRPFAAAALYRAGLARNVLLPTAGLADEEDDLVPPEHEIARRVLRRGGVPEDAVIVLPGVVHSTFDEARALAHFLDERPNGSVTVLTSDYHTRRTRWIFRRVVGERPSVHFAGVPPDGYGAGNWWRSEDGFRAYCFEYLKFGYYRLRY